VPDDNEPLDYAELHARALRLAGKAVAQVSLDDLDEPTPCSDWDLRALLNHMVSGNFWVRPLVAGRTITDVGDEFDGDLVGSEPISVYENSASDAADAFFAMGAMKAPCAVSYGPISGEEYCAHRTVDIVLHGWDVSQVVGAEYIVPADMIDAVRQIIEPSMESLRVTGIFGNEIGVPEDADEQTKLLAWFGRKATK